MPQIQTRMTTPNKTISTESLQQEGRTFPPSAEVLQRALINAPEFNALYEHSLREPEKFWLEQANTLEWFKKPTVAGKFTWDTAARKIEHTWFEDGTIESDRQLPRPPPQNQVARQDRHHLAGRRARTKSKKSLTRELHADVCKFANALKSLGIKKGDRVAIYMPMIPEAAVAMLACARIGAIHSVVFGGFSADSLSDRINDSDVQTC